MSDETLPAGVGPVLGAHGACPTIDYNGHTWSVSWPTQKAKAELEMLVVKIAKSAIEDIRETFTAEEWQREQDLLRSLIRAKQYKTWGALWEQVLGFGTNMLKYTTCALIRVKHPEFTLEMMEELWINRTDDVLDAYLMVTPNFMKLMAEDVPKTRGNVAEQLLAQMTAALAEIQKTRAQPQASIVTHSPASTTDS